ncbi:MAG: RsmB/NOP family class I SAM-dependent RNA methyltransferase [Pseudomonadota bacterium]
MTPGARVAAAIAILDQIIAGQPAEKALTAWARGSRYAGSKDRAAVRDHVFDALRARRSLGDGDGRDLMARLCQRDGADLDALFSGEGHAPTALTAAERDALTTPLELSLDAASDVPAWLWPDWQQSLGEAAVAAAEAQQRRAPVFLRVNPVKADVATALATLADDDIPAEPHQTVPGSLRVTGNARRIKNARAYAAGMVELQDAASQDAVLTVPVREGARVLDYCAGGGGKALAFAALPGVHVTAHDIEPARMQDIPSRATRAGVQIDRLPTVKLRDAGPFDVVFCDAPCSGSGTWRRTPDAKWRLTPDALDHYARLQDQVLREAVTLVRPGGILAYATCSVLSQENEDRIAAFQAELPTMRIGLTRRWLPSDAHDGFFLTVLHRA